MSDEEKSPEQLRAEVEQLRRLLAEREEAGVQGLRQTLDALSDGTWDCLLSQEKQQCYFSPKYHQLLGYPPDSIDSGRRWLELVHPADRPLVEDIGLQIRSGESDHLIFEFRVRAHDGSWRWLLCRSQVIVREPAGQVRRVVASVTDVTHLRQLEQVLRASEARLRAAIESLPMDFWMLGADGRYLMQNQRSREDWGDVVGLRPEELDVPPEVRTLFAENNRRVFSGETIREEVHFPINGKLHHVLNVVAPIKDREEILGILGVNLDISELKQAQLALERRNDELTQANAQLEKLQRARDELIAIVSHELRTPLVTGLGYIEMLLSGAYGQITDLAAARMSVALRNLRRLSALIDGMLEYQTMILRNYDQKLVSVPFDLGALAQETFSDFMVRSGVSAELASLELPEEPLWAVGDADKLHRVLANLLDNAARHAGPQARVRLTAARTEEGNVEVAVQDDGMGISEELQAKVFEPFVKFDQCAEGHGLGLAIVKGILEAQGAPLELRSAPGEGTRISFRLPASWTGAQPTE